MASAQHGTESSAQTTVSAVYEADAALKTGASVEAYRTLLLAARGGEVAARQLAATQLRNHCATFPALVDESGTALLALCLDAAPQVRLTAIGALPALVEAASGAAERRATMRRLLAAVEEMSLQATSLQVRTVQSSLTEIVDRHVATLLVVSLKLLPPAAPVVANGDVPTGDGAVASVNGVDGTAEAAEAAEVAKVAVEAPPSVSAWPAALGRYIRAHSDRISAKVTQVAAEAAAVPAVGAAADANAEAGRALEAAIHGGAAAEADGVEAAGDAADAADAAAPDRLAA
eukprot:1701266-Prymnesium_polylepis.1